MLLLCCVHAVDVHIVIVVAQLRECTAVLLMKLLDDKVPALMEGTQLLKALNVLMLKILDNCNRYRLELCTVYYATQITLITRRLV